MSYLIWAISSALVAAAIIAVMLRSGRTGPLDRPNERSLHATPIPRSGGVGIMAGVALGMVAAPPEPSIVAGMVLLAVVSWLDDRRSLPILIRFASHVIAAILSLATMDWGWLGLMAAVFLIVWMANLYNFMDGANGLAGGMAAFGFGAYAVAAAMADKAPLALLATCVAAAALGFLLFNFDPARIFMGDVGSIPLGFLAAVLGLRGVRVDAWPLWFPILVFSPFIVDATVTLLKRAARGEKFWQAHREHYYQRLIRSGWSHRRLALTAYFLMLATAGSACLLIAAPRVVQALVFGSWAWIYALLMRSIDRRLAVTSLIR